MNVIRPIELDDLDALARLAEIRKVGLTSLPKDKELLRKKILRSLRGFELVDGEDPHGESYLFVMEDLESGQIVGTSAMDSKVGGFEPFYTYKIEETLHESKSLKIKQKIPTLHLVVEHNGPCEIGTLFLHPDYRKGGNGRALSLSRFLFMAQSPQYFDPLVIAEIRGVIDDAGHSPFWDNLGKHFFRLDFATADDLSGTDKKFIADLMPRHPIYVPLLAQEAQRVIGEPNEKSKPALDILEAEGFRFCDMVDIFEAGPVISCPQNRIRTIAQNRQAIVSGTTSDKIDSEIFLLSNNSRDFRACKATLEILPDEKIRLPDEAAAALQVKTGDMVRYIPLFAAARKKETP